MTRTLLLFATCVPAAFAADPPAMPRDYTGKEQRPKPRTKAEVDAILAGAPNPALKTRPVKVLLVAGKKDHGKGEHDYPAWQAAWKELFAKGDRVTVDTAWEWPTDDQFKSADAVVLFQHGDWDEKRAAATDAYLERGGGLTYVHWAVDGRNNVADFAKRIGLASHGGQIKYRHGAMDLAFPNGQSHPILRNITKLQLVDESYWMLTGDLPKDRVLATQVEDKEPRPLFWTVEKGPGRVFVSIPGHFSWTFDDPIFRIILLRGIAWTAKEPVDRFNDLVWPGSDTAK
jgi:type 1 glutamine amidotransferase